MPWKRINDRFKRDCDKAVEAVLRDVEVEGGDRAAAQVDATYAKPAALKLQRGPRGVPPPKG